MATEEARLPEAAVPFPWAAVGELRSAAQLDMLHRLARRLNQLNDVPQIGEAIASELRFLIDYHNCRVHLISDDGITMLPVAFRGELSEYQGETFDALILKVGQGVTGRVALTGESYYSPNTNDDPYAVTIPGTPEVDESLLVVPLRYAEKVIGTVALAKLGLDQFDDQDMRVLEVLASHAAVAIENARRYHELEQAAERLRALDEIKNMFLDAVSHELRTPLAAVLGIALTLKRSDVELSPTDREDLVERLATNARKLERLLSDLLDLDRLTRGILQPNRHLTDVGALVRRVVENFELMDGHRMTTIADTLQVSIDAPKVERIVENLLANTVRHTPAGSRVWVRVIRENDGIVIIVEDDGPGVPEDLRESIFEPFRQGPNRPAHSPGVGIGLSLVASFSELHGGRAWVEERAGGGASFRVFLPYSDPV